MRLRLSAAALLYYVDVYKRQLLRIAFPIMIQNGITNFVALLDNIMIGAVGTDQMSGVSDVYKRQC